MQCQNKSKWVISVNGNAVGTCNEHVGHIMEQCAKHNTKFEIGYINESTHICCWTDESPTNHNIHIECTLSDMKYVETNANIRCSRSIELI